MYVVVHHQIKDQQTAFARGLKLMTNEGAPSGTRVLQFYPAQDGSAVTCLWESASIHDVQGFVDATLGDASVNTSYEVAADKAFAERPLGISGAPAGPPATV